jgi:hypothetical protein
MKILQEWLKFDNVYTIFLLNKTRGQTWDWRSQTIYICNREVYINEHGEKPKYFFGFIIVISVKRVALLIYVGSSHIEGGVEYGTSFSSSK